MTWPVDPAAINTALLIGVAGYLWRQSRKVDEMRQALIGLGKDTGLIAEMKMVRERTHELAGKIQELNGTVEHLSWQLEALRERQPGEERRQRKDG